jgi:hypothetical protein
VGVDATIEGLVPAGVYHYRLHVSYAGGSVSGADVTFATVGAAPTVYVGEPSNITQSSASLNASVNPNGTATTCRFEYGASASYGASVPCSLPVGEGRAPVPVSASLSSLAANSAYHFRVVAANVNGTSYGPDQALALLPPAPSAKTLLPSAITHTSARLNATVNANGAALTSCEFEFESADTLVPCAPHPAPPLIGAVAVSASVTGLAPGARFRYRIIAANAGGSTYGSLVEFVSLPTTAQLASRNAARLVSARLHVPADGEIHAKLACPAAHRARCRGTITLSTEARGVRGRTRTLATGTFGVRAGGVVALRLHPTGFARHLLSHQGILHARATVRTTGSGGTSGIWRAAVVLTPS